MNIINLSKTKPKSKRLALKQLVRRLILLKKWLTLKKLFNLFKLGLTYIIAKKKVLALPPMIKVELSAVCNLNCTVCLHAERSDLQNQDFSGQMQLSTFKKLVDDIKDKTLALSLYYMGEALLYPDIIEALNYTSQNKLATHINSNFSFNLSDQQITKLINSGLTHLTICIDGLTNETYQKTRINGDVNLVLNNLKRLIAEKKKLKTKWPQIEVQYIQFPHNEHELDQAMALFKELGIHHTAIIKGSLHNYIDMHPDNYEIKDPLMKKNLPRCWWPWGSVTIKHTGEVLPCCYHRIAEQYVPGKIRPIMGNINHDSLTEIWNNKPYQNMRAACKDPSLFESDPKFKQFFCYGCDKLFQTTKSQNIK